MIAITGGTGFIGQWILKLYSSKFKFKVLTRCDTNSNKYYQNDNIIYHKTDYSKESLKNILRDCKSIIHLAAIKVENNLDDKFESYLDNIIISENLFIACNELGIDNVVSISSRTVYPFNQDIEYSEQSLINPINVYGIVKATIELLAEQYNKTYNMKIKSLRVSQVLGIGDRDTFMFGVFLNKCINKQTITLYGEGKGERNYIYVKDVAKAIMLAIKNYEREGIYNIANKETISHKQLAEVMCEIFENSNNIIYLTDKTEDISKQKINTNKAESELGFICDYNIVTMIKDIKLILEEDCDEYIEK